MIDDLGYFYKIGVDTDFTGKLFNIMFRWLSFAGDDQNDVVLTPRYVALLMAKLARVNKDSYVWDFVTGFRVIIMTQANSQVNTRVLELLPKFKIKKMNRWCFVL